MPTEAVLMHLSNAGEMENLQMQVILQSAPVLKNVKMSCMFTIPSAYTKILFSLFRRTELKVCCLCHGVYSQNSPLCHSAFRKVYPQGTPICHSAFHKVYPQGTPICHSAFRKVCRDVVLIYREEQLEDHLKEQKVAEFLQQYGYEGNSIKSYLKYLGERISYFYNRAEGYPHEMGIFLGYPLEDVRGFIRHKGKNCHYTGYWKVYSDVEHAKRTFRTYDEAKDMAIMEFFAGKKMWEIAC